MLNPVDISRWNAADLHTFARSLGTRCVGSALHFLPSTSSTNDVAKQLARGGGADGAVVIAAQQTQGRGRLERSWHSPAGGLWMSVIFSPGEWRHNASLLTLLAAVPCAQAIEEITNLTVGIKWSNDLRIGQRKVAGILGELQSLPGGAALILGIGVNVNVKSEDFPLRLRSTATSLRATLSAEVDAAQLLKSLLIRLDQCYLDFQEGATDEWIEGYRRQCVSLGQTVTVDTPAGDITGIALDIDASGALQIRMSDGAVQSLIAGDVNHIDHRVEW